MFGHLFFPCHSIFFWENQVHVSMLYFPFSKGLGPMVLFQMLSVKSEEFEESKVCRVSGNIFDFGLHRYLVILSSPLFSSLFSFSNFSVIYFCYLSSFLTIIISLLHKTEFWVRWRCTLVSFHVSNLLLKFTIFFGTVFVISFFSGWIKIFTKVSM